MYTQVTLARRWEAQRLLSSRPQISRPSLNFISIIRIISTYIRPLPMYVGSHLIRSTASIPVFGELRMMKLVLRG